MSILSQYRLQLLGALAAFSLAAVALMSSGASFTSTTANPGNLFTAGDLRHSNSKDNAAIFTSTAKLRPGGAASTGTVTISNTGDSAGVFTLTADNLVDTPGPGQTGVLSGKLDLVITDGATTVYSGKLGSIPAGGIVLDGDLVTSGSQAFPATGANATHTYAFSVSFPDGGVPASATSGDNAFKAASTSIRFNWNAVSNGN